MTTLTIRRPDDWHLHLRDGDMLKAVAPETARDFARAIIMPNLVPPVVTAADATAYRDRIVAALPAGSDFQPLMTLYLTEGTDPADLAAAHESGLITAVKLYPAGATTNNAPVDPETPSHAFATSTNKIAPTDAPRIERPSCGSPLTHRFNEPKKNAPQIAPTSSPA